MEAMTSEREAFEKFHREIFGQGTIDPSGALFRTWKAACAWNTCNWQARAHLAQPAQAVDVGAIREVIADMRDTRLPPTPYLWCEQLTRALSAEKAGPVGDEDMALIPRHYASNIQVAACMMEQSGNVLDRREAPVLRKIAALLTASPTPGKEGKWT